MGIKNELSKRQNVIKILEFFTKASEHLADEFHKGTVPHAADEKWHNETPYIECRSNYTFKDVSFDWDEAKRLIEVLNKKLAAIYACEPSLQRFHFDVMQPTDINVCPPRIRLMPGTDSQKETSGALFSRFVEIGDLLKLRINNPYGPYANQYSFPDTPIRRSESLESKNQKKEQTEQRENNTVKPQQLT